MSGKSGLSVEKRGGFLVIRPESRLGKSEVEEFSAMFDSMVERGENYIAIDLCEVQSVSSTGMGVLLQAHHELQRRNGRLLLGNVSPDVEKMIAFSRLENVFEITEDLESVLKTSEDLVGEAQAASPAAEDDDGDSIL